LPASTANYFEIHLSLCCIITALRRTSDPQLSAKFEINVGFWFEISAGFEPVAERVEIAVRPPRFVDGLEGAIEVYMLQR